MNQTNQTVQAPTSFSDCGYKAAANRDLGLTIARWVVEKCPTFIDDCPKEVREELFTGFRLRWSHNNPAKEFVVVDGNLVLKADVKVMPKKAEVILIGMEQTYAYGQQAFGKLKDSKDGIERAKHAIMKPMRDACSNYCGQRLKELIADAKSLTAGTAKRSRGATKDFGVTVEDTLKTLTTKCKTALGRDDETADAKRLERAVAAFRKEWSTK